MNLVFTIFGAFALGWFVRPRGRAVLAYLIADSFLFTYQTAYLVVMWTDESSGAFGGHPYDADDVVMYGVLNLILIGAGIGLVVLGARMRERRTSPSAAHEVVAR